jgi:hypothetical protein
LVISRWSLVRSLVFDLSLVFGLSLVIGPSFLAGQSLLAGRPRTNDQRPTTRDDSSPQEADRLSDRLLVDVSATEPWTDTGLVVAAGDRIQIRAWGTVKFDGGREGATATPRGVPGPAGGCSFVATDPKVPGYSLIANIAPSLTLDGHAVFVGTQWTGTLPIAGTSATRGRLFLGFNDKAVMCDRSGYDSWGFRNDNNGVFVVDVSVSRGR